MQVNIRPFFADTVSLKMRVNMTRSITVQTGKREMFYL